MDLTPKPVDKLYLERVMRAREMSPEAKVLLGFELFEQECRAMAESIRKQFPHASEARVQEILQNRLRRQREREEQGIYYPVPLEPNQR